MALIRIPVPGTEHVIEFDSDEITSIETPREVTDVPGEPGRKELPGPNSLILHFAALDDAPKWVPPGQHPPEPPVLLAALEAMAMLIREEYGIGGQHGGSPIAPEVRIFTDATDGQAAAVDAVERYWEAIRSAEPAPGAGDAG